LANGSSPMSALKKHANTLHLKHRFVLGERRILRLQPIKPFGRAYFLDIDILKQRLKMAMPFTDIRPCKRSNGIRPLGVDVAKQTALNLVVD
jgi:hypothetical protein